MTRSRSQAARRKRRTAFTPPAKSPPWTGTPVPPDVNVYLNGTKEHDFCAPCARKLRAKGKQLLVQRQSRRKCERCVAGSNDDGAGKPNPPKAPQPRTVKDILAEVQATATELNIEPGNIEQLRLF